jgi:hypothetical protein
MSIETGGAWLIFIILLMVGVISAKSQENEQVNQDLQKQIASDETKLIQFFVKYLGGDSNAWLRTILIILGLLLIVGGTFWVIKLLINR